MKVLAKAGRRWKTGGIMAAVAALVVTAGALAKDASTIGSVVALHGEVLVTTHGRMQTHQLTEGEALYEGDHIETAKGGRARIRLQDGSIIQLGARSTLDIEWVLYAPALDSRNVILSMPGGIVRLIVETFMPRSSFEMKTRTAITAARGTDWIVQADQNATSILVLDGEVSVGNVRPHIVGNITLTPGSGTQVKLSEPPADAKAWPDARRDAFIRKTDLP